MCSIGKVLKEVCDKTTHTSKIGRRMFKDFSEEEIAVICKRSGFNVVTSDSELDICFHHDNVFLEKYSRNQTKCCDPFTTHKSAAKHKVEISMDLSVDMDKLQLKVIRGQKLYKRCHEKVTEKLKLLETPKKSTDFDNVDDLDFPDPDPLDIESDTNHSELNTSLVELGFSLLKLHVISTQSRVLHRKRKMEKVEMKQAEDTDVVMNKMAKALDVSPEQLKSLNKAKEYDRHMGLVKSKINDTHDKREIVQLLTLAPQSWGDQISSEKISKCLPTKGLF